MLLVLDVCWLFCGWSDVCCVLWCGVNLLCCVVLGDVVLCVVSLLCVESVMLNIDHTPRLNMTK